jgi:hypothetical protein
MDSGIHIQLARTKLQDALRDAETARAARRPPHERPHTGLATAWQRQRPAPALNGSVATTTGLGRRRFRTGAPGHNARSVG